MTDLGTLDPDGNGATVSADINSRRQIVGYSTIAGIPRAFLYENGAISDLAHWLAAMLVLLRPTNMGTSSVSLTLPVFGP